MQQSLADAGGLLTFAFDGVEESYSPGPGDPLTTPGSCRATYQGGDLIEGYDGDVVYLSCSSGNGRVILLPVFLGDLRALGVGSFPASNGQYASYYYDRCVADMSCRGDCSAECSLAVPAGAATVTIEEATGARAPAPRFVTADYGRTFRIDVNYPSAVRGTNDCGSRCSGSVTVRGSVRFRVSAAQYVADFNAPCVCGL